MKADLETLADLFALSYHRTGSIRTAIEIVLSAADAGKAGVKLRTSMREMGPERREQVAACEPTIEQVAREARLTAKILRSRDVSPEVKQARYKAYVRLAKQGRSLRTIALALRRTHRAVQVGLLKSKKEGTA